MTGVLPIRLLPILPLQTLSDLCLKSKRSTSFTLDPLSITLTALFINKKPELPMKSHQSSGLYPGLDSNQHTMRHCHLKTACLPISPPGLEDGCKITYSLHISTIILQNFLRKFISSWTSWS